MKVAYARSFTDPRCPEEVKTDKSSIASSVKMFSAVPLGTVIEVLGIIQREHDLVDYLLRDPRSNWAYWFDSWFFDVVDTSIPANWIVNVWSSAKHAKTGQLVIGPRYFAGSSDDYIAFVDVEPEPMKAYYENLKSLGLYLV